jgi:hypothetical protein
MFGSPSNLLSFIFGWPPPPPPPMTLSAFLSGAAPEPTPPPTPAPPPTPLQEFLAGFYFDGSADELFTVQRNSASGQIVHPIGSTATVLDGDSLSFGSTRGDDLQLRAGYDMIGVEWRSLGPMNWASNGVDLGAVGNVQIASINNFGAIDLNAASHSSFNASREFNVRLRIAPWLTVFGGKRSFSLYDETDLNITFPAFSAAYSYDIPWQAEGHQIGAEVRVFGPGTPWEAGAVLRRYRRSDRHL